uniref:CCHC-type domain-containing protein n=1 Tax=Chenopodium quinoa TaxID=63459 RepID=A0A803MH37_CHEQI
MAADKGEVKLEKFDGKDFGFWKMQIEDYLYQKKLYQPLEEKKPYGMQEAEWKLLDRQALGVIRLTLSRNVAFNSAKETTTAGLMKALSNMYEKPSVSNKVHLMRRLFSLRMSEGGSVAQHLNELNSVTTQLSYVEIKFDDEVLALILLSSVPDSWNATVTAVSSSSGNNKLKFDDVRDLVLSEEIRRRESGESSSYSILHTESRGRNLIRRNERGRSNYRGQSRDRRSKSRKPNNFQNSKTVECWNCGKIGHYKNQCKGTPKGKEVKAEANVTSTGEGDDALICSLESKEESWVLDSRALFHATSNKNFFEKYVHRNLGQVYLGDDQPCDIVGQGNVKIKLNGSAWELKDVKHVPDLRKNLISVGQLAREDRHKIESYETNQKESTFIDEDYVPDSTVQEYTIISTPQQEEQAVQGSTSQSNDIQQPSCPTPTLRRSTRPHVPNRKYMNYLLLTDDGEPEDYYEASQTRDASKWGLAMKDEMQSLISNQTWELTELPIGKKALHNKWIYRAKKEHDDSKRYKARLVVKGFQQKEGVDYNEIFAPVVKLNTIRTVLSIVAIEDLYLEQLDVKTAFLHGHIQLNKDQIKLGPTERVVADMAKLQPRKSSLPFPYDSSYLLELSDDMAQNPCDKSYMA